VTKAAAILSTLLLLSGCGLPVVHLPERLQPNVPTKEHAIVNAARYHHAGLQAERSREYAQARYHFERALVENQRGNGTVAFASMATYNLGRMMGYTCDYAEAERLLLESLALEERLPDAFSGNIAKRLFELGRLNQDQGKFGKAQPYYERAIPLAEQLGLATSDPAGFVGVLDDYASVLERTGSGGMAETIRARAGVLRAQHPGKMPRVVFVRYNQTCSP
jgi:tetratricopeptide (TPR) repeat protein